MFKKHRYKHSIQGFMDSLVTGSVAHVKLVESMFKAGSLTKQETAKALKIVFCGRR